MVYNSPPIIFKLLLLNSYTNIQNERQMQVTYVFNYSFNVNYANSKNKTEKKLS